MTSRIDSAVVDSMSWQLAAALAVRCGPGYRLREEHPGGGQYDVLALRAQREQPVVLLNRAGSVQVHSADHSELMRTSAKVWDELAMGTQSVEELAGQVAAVLHAEGVAPGPVVRAEVLRLVAEVMRMAALFRLGWRCHWAVEDTSGPTDGDAIRTHLAAPYGNLLDPQLQDAARKLRDDHAPESVEGPWFVVGGDDKPIACFEVSGRVHRHSRGPSGPSVDTIELSAADLQNPAWVTATALFADQVQREAKRVQPKRPGLGLPAVLAAFNRKERYFLLGAAATELPDAEVHGPSMRVTNAFRTRLGEATGWHVPRHAWVGMDYHLSWVHAALEWFAGEAWPHQPSPHPSQLTDDGALLVSGSQEDVDLIVCWSSSEGPRLALVEAKGYGAWTKKQADSKLARLAAIVAAAQAQSAVDVRFVLASPRPSSLQVAGWPAWATRAGGNDALWVQLPVPTARLSTQRVNDEGASASTGTRWRIVGPGTGF